MTPLEWLAAAVLWVEWPVPVYWLLLHPLVGFWRRRSKAGLIVAALVAWGSGTVAMVALHRWLFVAGRASLGQTLAGLALISADVAMLAEVNREMGGERLMGRAELEGKGELNTRGIYGVVRHPRYTAMMAGVLGACLLGASLLTWVLSAAWWALALFAVLLEERELRHRFGAAYEDYQRRVPAFLPVRLIRREK